MQKALILKTLLISVLTLLLSFALSLVGNLVSERKERQSEVVQEISSSYAESQDLIGPILVIPFEETYFDTPDSPSAKNKKNKPEKRLLTQQNFYYPSQLVVDGDLNTDTKRRGLFKAMVYQWDGILSGQFSQENLPTPKPLHKDGTITVGEPYLILSVRDTRGLAGVPELTWAGQTLHFEPGSPLPALSNVIHAKLPRLSFPFTLNTPISFSLRLSLRGTESFSLLPLGTETRMEMRSPWPHPSFTGRILPDPGSQRVGSTGFSAIWQTSTLSSNAQSQANHMLRTRHILAGNSVDVSKGTKSSEASTSALPADTVNLYDLDRESIHVSIVEPINIYALANRALKYGFLIITLCFTAFFLFEMLKRWRIHPAQYGFVGLTQALFFLLLLSLSEHIAFGKAYLVAATGVITLTTYYLSFVLGGIRRALGFGALLTIIFGALYGLLISEDNALMLGALLLFTLLASAMIATRKLDWYAEQAPGLQNMEPSSK